MIFDTLTKMILTTRWRWSLCLTVVIFILLYYSLSLSDQNIPFSEISKQSNASQRPSQIQYPSSQMIYEDIKKIKGNYNENDEFNKKNSIKTNEYRKTSIKPNKESKTSKYFNSLKLVLDFTCISSLILLLFK